MVSVSIPCVKTLSILGCESESKIIYVAANSSFSISTILKAIYFYCVLDLARDMKMVSICT